MLPAEQRPPGPGIKTLDERLGEAEQELLRLVRVYDDADADWDIACEDYRRLYAERSDRRAGEWS